MDGICKRIDLWKKGDYPFFIYEFEHSIFVVGDHQFYKGYSLILFKRHVRELHELSEREYLGLQRELYTAGNAIYKTYHPWKMNYMSLGNQDEHIHWHIFPRYLEDKNHRNFPMTELIKGDTALDDIRINADEARTVALEIRRNIEPSFKKN